MSSLPAVVALLLLAGSTVWPAPAVKTCDTDCAQAVAAAIDWVLQDMKNVAADDRPITAFFLDSSVPREGSQVGPRARQAEGIRRAAVAAAVARGISHADATQHPAWVACRSSALHPTCIAENGTARIFVTMVEATSDNMMLVHAGFQVIRHSGAESQIGWAQSRGADLRLVRSASGWRVANVEMRIVS
jgi:hypothetical protein